MGKTRSASAQPDSDDDAPYYWTPNSNYSISILKMRHFSRIQPFPFDFLFFFLADLANDDKFQGPLAKRSCTDVVCLLIFIAFLGGWIAVAYFGKHLLSSILILIEKQINPLHFTYCPNVKQHMLQLKIFPAFRHGGIDDIFVPTDSNGYKCGSGSNKNKDYLLIFDLEKYSTYWSNALDGGNSTTPTICVIDCPKTNFLFDMKRCKQRFSETHSKLICRSDVDKNQIKSCEDIETFVRAGKCTKWYLESKSSKL